MDHVPVEEIDKDSSLIPFLELRKPDHRLRWKFYFIKDDNEHLTQYTLTDMNTSLCHDISLEKFIDTRIPNANSAVKDGYYWVFLC